MQGMQQLVKARPENPVAWLGEFLLEHNPQKQKIAEAAEQQQHLLPAANGQTKDQD
jgi:hypothetical protein